MLALRLVRLIESRADSLAQGLLDRLLSAQECSDLRRVPAMELRDRTYEVFSNLSDWIVGGTEDELARRYREIGAVRAAQGVALSHIVWAYTATRDYLREFLDREAFVDTHVELHGELELLARLDRFFDRAIYFAAQGHEGPRAARAA